MIASSTPTSARHFLVARIDDLSAKLTDDQLTEIRLGNDVVESADADRPFELDTFLLDPIENVFDRPRRINFCTITPVSMAAQDEIQKLKKAELDQTTRVLLRRKLALFFGRDADDIPDEEKTEAPKLDAVPNASD
jgi:hypothetical protein